MKDETLKQIWQQSQTDVQLKIDQERLTMELKYSIQEMKEKIRRRNMKEVVAAIVVGLFFGAFLVTDQPAMTKAGSGILVLYALFVAFRLKWAEKKQQEADVSADVQEQLQKGKAYLKVEKRLLKTVHYWYLLPPFLGIALFWGGMDMHWIMYTGAMLVLTWVYVEIYRMNQRAAKNEFDPIIQKIEKALEDLGR